MNTFVQQNDFTKTSKYAKCPKIHVAPENQIRQIYEKNPQLFVPCQQSSARHHLSFQEGPKAEDYKSKSPFVPLFLRRNAGVECAAAPLKHVRVSVREHMRDTCFSNFL